MRYRLTRDAEKQAKTLGLDSEAVIRMAKFSAPYTDNDSNYFNRQFEEHLLRVGDSQVHAIMKAGGVPTEQITNQMELLISARDALRDTITEGLDPAIRENAEWVLARLEEVTPL